MNISKHLLIGSFISICLTFCFHTSLDAQRFLVIEKKFTKRKLRFEPGDQITFQVRQDSTWRTSTIMGFDYPNRVIYLDGLTVFADSILSVKSYKPLIPEGIGKTLMFSGASFGGTSALAAIFFQAPNALPFLIVGGGIVATGWGLQQLSKIRKTYPIGRKYNIRLIDTDFYNIKP